MHILIVKLSSLGDVIQTMPVIADILAAHPEAQIDWVVEEAFAPLVARVQGVRRVIPIAQRRWRKSWLSGRTRQERAAFKAQLLAQTYDAVIDCQGLTKSALVSRMASLTQHGLRGSFANKSEACSYEWPVQYLLAHNQPMPKRIHAIDRMRLLAAKLLGYETRPAIWQSAPTVVFKSLSKRQPASSKVMFVHGTTRVEKEWARQDWQFIANELIKLGKKIVLPQANAREQGFCEVLALTYGDDILVQSKMDLSQVLDVMAECESVIGVDSGLSHMAIALDLPTVQIFKADIAWRAGAKKMDGGGVEHQLALGGGHVPSADEVFEAWTKVVSC